MARRYFFATINGVTQSYDAAGNLTGNGSTTWTYNARGRLVSAKLANATVYNYGINGLGQRVSKSGTAVSTGRQIYVYDEAGHLIGEYNNSGVRVWEHVYLGDLPVAVIASDGGVFPVLSDHLGTPRQVINASKQLRWQWDNTEPFGANLANQNPANLGVFAYNLRFPGQYFDAETGLHYNMFRDFNPQTGRYIESDPIGLSGGLNTFGYAYQNPVMFTDPIGLIPGAVCDVDGCETLDDDCGCLAKAFLGWEDLTVVGAAAATGPTLPKPRGGIAGGGPSGSRTSPLSRMVHVVNKSVGKSATTAAVRNFGRVVFKAIPGVGAVVMLYDIAVYNECMQKCKECQK